MNLSGSQDNVVLAVSDPYQPHWNQQLLISFDSYDGLYYLCAFNADEISCS